MAEKGDGVRDYLPDDRVPVLFPDGTPAMPTKFFKAKRLVKEKKAFVIKNNLGVFCIELRKWPKTKNTQDVVIGLDPGKSYTGIAVQSLKSTLLGIHLVLPIEEDSWSRTKKVKKICYDTKSNREYENIICKEIMKLYPINLIVMEVSKTKKPRKEWNSTLVGQDWQIKKLSKIVELKIVDGVQTADYRKKLNFYKQKKRKGEFIPETQVVDGIALAASGFLNRDKKIHCTITSGVFIHLIGEQIKRNKKVNYNLNDIYQIDYSTSLRRTYLEKEKVEDLLDDDSDLLCVVGNS